MQIFKWLPTICAIAFLASFIPARADDTPAPAAAGAAQDQKAGEMDSN
jgi:hypothetical protein